MSKGKAIKDVNFDLDIGPLMIDKNSADQPVKFYSNKRRLNCDTGKWNDGWLNEQQIFTRPALFSEMSISIDTKSLLQNLPPPIPLPPPIVPAPVPIAAVKADATAPGSATNAVAPTQPAAPDTKANVATTKPRTLKDAIRDIKSIQITFACEGIRLMERSSKTVDT